MEGMNDRSDVMLTRILDLTSERHRILAHNLANINTPGYRRMDLDFSEELAIAAQQGITALRNLAIEGSEDPHAPARADGNNVILETEMAEMSKNAMMHQLALSALQQKLSIKRTAITGRA
ncbi:MAG: flagellar basal body rod protein FlgB [Planctomycetota bacterium]|nr:flagellar basal body rod protein FlgB [Planctomycetota bacterium]